MNPLSKIIESGFSLEIADDELIVSPFSKLTDAQRQYLKAHKQNIIEALTVTQWYCFKTITDGAALFHYVVGWCYADMVANYPDAVVVPMVEWLESND